MIRILVDPAPIDIAAEMALAEAGPDDGGAGAVATFTGLVRTDDGVDHDAMAYFGHGGGYLTSRP